MRAIMTHNLFHSRRHDGFWPRAPDGTRIKSLPSLPQQSRNEGRLRQRGEQAFVQGQLLLGCPKLLNDSILSRVFKCCERVRQGTRFEVEQLFFEFLVTELGRSTL